MVRDDAAASRRRCAFPLWRHGDRAGISPRFCEAPVLHDPVTDRHSPYCPDHHRKCYAGLRYVAAKEKAAQPFVPGARRAKANFL